jgi:spore coat polysaccharide biosynthesis protein SpsF
VAWSSGLDLSASHRLTLDYREDFELISRVFEALHRPGQAPFSVEEIVAYLDANPDVAALNAAHRGTGWIDRHRHELRSLQPRAATGAGATAMTSARSGGLAVTTEDLQ